MPDADEKGYVLRANRARSTCGDRMLSALHTISTWPFDFDSPVFTHYPAMKLGHFESVSYFAESMTPMALKLLGDEPEPDRGWVLTSPLLWGLPCGANLVCRAIHAQLAKILPRGQAPYLDQMEVQGSRIPFRNRADFEDYNNYSSKPTCGSASNFSFDARCDSDVRSCQFRRPPRRFRE